ncbi:hypothetical protein Hanom_Chr06g00513381 [Helianthus anomalus]
MRVFFSLIACSLGSCCESKEAAAATIKMIKVVSRQASNRNLYQTERT